MKEIEVENPLTCGKGLAEYSVIPAKLGELIASVAENLDVHSRALDLEDESSRGEYDAYLKAGEGTSRNCDRPVHPALLRAQIDRQEEASGISSSQKQKKLISVGVIVSPTPLKAWGITRPQA